MRDLSEIRKDINRSDDELIKLFSQRMECAKEVGRYKKERGIPVLNEQRERENQKDDHTEFRTVFHGRILPLCVIRLQRRWWFYWLP